MRNIKLEIAYCGTHYHGFQIQNNALTIQGAFEQALDTIVKERGSVQGCSRTDAGVHARSYVLNFKTSSTISCEALAKGLNALLPHDIVVKSVQEVDLDFHARFDAHGKEYIYLIHNALLRDPFLQNLALEYRYRLDEVYLQQAAQMLVGEHDFAAYCAAGATVKSTVREIYRFDVRRKGDLVEFVVCGNGFLYNMVRILAGTLIYLSEGKRSEADILASLKTGDRTLAGKTLPPHGLYLNRVIY